MGTKTIQKTKKQHSKVAIFIMLCGIIIGGALLLIGLFKKIDANKVNIARAEAAQTQSEEKYTAAQKQYQVNADKLDSLKTQLNNKTAECSKLSGNYSKTVICNNEKFNLQKDINSLETEQFQLKNGDYRVFYSIVEPITYNIFFYIGGGILVAALIAGGIVYLVGNKRK